MPIPSNYFPLTNKQLSPFKLIKGVLKLAITSHLYYYEGDIGTSAAVVVAKDKKEAKEVVRQNSNWKGVLYSSNFSRIK